MNLAEPWQYDFFKNGIVAATLAGGICALVGLYVVLRHMSYIGHGLSHAIFGGAVVSYITGINYYLGAGLWGLASALLIAQISKRRQVGSDAAIGIVTTASFAVGVALISRGHKFSQNFEAVLFGNVLAVSSMQVKILAATALLSSLVVMLLYRPLMFVTFDPEVAPIYGVRTGLVDAIFILVLATTIISTMQVLGVTLLAAALVIPPVTARLISDSFKIVLAVSTLIGAACGFLGMYLSYVFNVASGPTIVLSAATLFALTYLTNGAIRRTRLSASRRLDSKKSPDLSELLQ